VKFTLNGLYERLGLAKDEVATGPQAGFFADTRLWSAEDLAAVKENQWAMYRQWIARIAEDRGMAITEVDSLGRGRVWTGQQALDRGLVDRLGGLDAALVAVREAAGIPAGDRVTLEHYPRPDSWLSRFLGLDLSNLAGDLGGRWQRREEERLRSIASGTLSLYELPLP
jgi:protease-4